MKLEIDERVRVLRSTTAKLLRDRDRIAEKLTEEDRDDRLMLVAAFAETNRELGRRDAGERRG